MSNPNARIVHNSGQGGFLCPPSHPMHTTHVETDLHRQPENRGSMSLEYALTCEWIDESVKIACRKLLADWDASKPGLDDPTVKTWVRSTLAYFRGCYDGGDQFGDRRWDASNLRTNRDADPMLNVDLHAGVHFVLRYYPDFMPTADDFTGKWGE